jgi:hypothetical protein
MSLRRTIMTAFTSLSRELTCAFAAAVITYVGAMSFVDSTSATWGAHSPAARVAAMQPQHAWFGQPEPAVLVD